MMGIPDFLVALVICLLITQYLKSLWKSRQYPSGPILLPFIGSLWKVGLKLRPDSLLKIAKSHGDVFTLWIAHIPVVVLSGFEAVKDALVGNSEALSGRPMFPFFKVLGNEKGIMFSNGETWWQQRHFGQAILQKLVLEKKDLEHQIGEEGRQLVETFAHEKGEPIDPSLHILHSVSKMICAAAFGHPFPIEDKALHELTEHINTITKSGCSAGVMLYNMFPSLMKYIPGPHKKAISSCEFIRSFIRKEVENHKKNGPPHERQGFVDFYLAQLKKEKTDFTSTFDEDNLVQSVADFFIAGTDPTAATLSWALLFMVAHPDIQAKVQDELDNGLESFKVVCYDDRKKLPYTRAVLNEIQRFSNVKLFGLPKLSTESVNIGGNLIPKETLVVTDLCSVLLDPAKWETPQKFNPNHFLDKDGKFIIRDEFLPFGAGERACLGKQFARTQLFIFFACLLKVFTFRLPEGVKDVNTEPATGCLVHPHPYKICAIPR
ncbi:cytochrome P450 2J5-like [Eublepharis macularius]|uniref:Cytochrome P450 2J5-like n=1 Tax=Eublepharis macularius TaxID=481883 RepID=A0AA97JIS9_EUBMA|nr:cytochrome P450 2J5-like [Eublepharis macularius]